MMTSTTIPSVLIVRSSCVTRDSDVDSPSPLASSTEMEAASIGPKTEAELLSINTRMRDLSIDSLPLSCDITILPELPIDESSRDGSNSKRSGTNPIEPSPEFIRLPQQLLNPCGVDNVFLLPDLPPAADQSGFLLSLTSCYSIMTDTERTPAAAEPLLLPVKTTPSTFSFGPPFMSSHTAGSGSFETTVSENDRDYYQDGPITGASFDGAFATLDVAFDLSEAAHHLVHALQWQPPNDAGIDIDIDIDTENENETHSVEPNESGLPTMPSVPLVAVQHTAKEIHDSAFPLLRTIMEKEARDMNLVLFGFGAILILLCSLYLWLAFQLVPGRSILSKMKQGMQSRLRISQYVQKIVLYVGTFRSRWPSRALAKKDRDDTKEPKPTVVLSSEYPTPPVTSVRLKVRTPFNSPAFQVTSVGSISHECISSASSDSIAALTDSLSILTEHEDVHQKATSLSPISKLVRNWERTKSTRRSSRNPEGKCIEKISALPSRLPAETSRNANMDGTIMLGPSLKPKKNCHPAVMTPNLNKYLLKLQNDSDSEIAASVPHLTPAPSLTQTAPRSKNSSVATTESTSAEARPLQERENGFPEELSGANVFSEARGDASFLQDYWGK